MTVQLNHTAAAARVEAVVVQVAQLDVGQVRRVALRGHGRRHGGRSVSAGRGELHGDLFVRALHEQAKHR